MKRIELIIVVVLTLVAATGWARLPDPVAFGVAMELGSLDEAQAWLNEGLPPNFLADRIGSGMMIAAWEGNVPLMEVFLHHGADMNFRNANDEQALQLAAWKGQTAAVEWLLAHGAALDRGEQAWSALHYAVFAGHGDLVKLLLARGASVNARAPNGSTVLMMAAREGHEDIARALLSAGADPSPRNDWGDSALTWAMRQGNLRIARMVSSAEDFATAARMPPQSFGQAIRSIPPPARISELLRQIRIAETQGKPTEALRKAFHEAVDAFKRDVPMKATAKPFIVQPKLPRALLITAKRAKPGTERAEVVYAPPAVGKTDDPAELLRQLRQAEAAGQPTEALRRVFMDAVRRYKGGGG